MNHKAHFVTKFLFYSILSPTNAPLWRYRSVLHGTNNAGDFTSTVCFVPSGQCLHVQAVFDWHLSLSLFLSLSLLLVSLHLLGQDNSHLYYSKYSFFFQSSSTHWHPEQRCNQDEGEHLKKKKKTRKAQVWIIKWKWMAVFHRAASVSGPW